MSTHIAEIRRGDRSPVALTQFGGGKRGLCIYVSTGVEAGCQGITFTKAEAQQLVREIQNWLGENELFQKQMEKKVECTGCGQTFTDDY